MPLVIYSNSSSTIKSWRTAEGWPYNPLIMYQEVCGSGGSWLYQGVVSTSSVTPTVINGYDVPKNAQSVLLDIYCSVAGTVYLVDALGTMQVAAVVGVNNQVKVVFPKGGPNTFSVYATTAGANVTIWCMGYYLHL